MLNAVTSVGKTVAVAVLIFTYQQLRPWLKEQATKTDTPLDGWVLDLLDKLLDLADKKGG
jgi:hypothetical protein